MKARHPVMVAVLLVASMLVMYQATVMQMVSVWARSDTFAHGFLIAPITLWLLWRERARLAAVALEPSVTGHVLIVWCGIFWLLAALVDVRSPAQFAFVGMLLAVVRTVFGRRLFRAAAFPLAFLLFAPPAGEFLLPYMMEATADFTTWAVAASGVPVYREGLQFRIPSGQWSVVEACSGLRYLIASLVAGSLYAYLNFRSVRRRLVFIALSVLVPVLANWLRAYFIVMLGHLSSNRLASGADHLVYGWVFFAAVMAMLFALGSRFREEDEAAPVGAEVTGPGAWLWPHALAALVLAAWPPLAFWFLDARMAPPVNPVDLPEQVGGWVRVGSPWSWRPHWVGAEVVQGGAYGRGGAPVGVVVAHYLPAGRPTSSDNVLVKSSDPLWSLASSKVLAVEGIGRVTEAIVHGPEGRLRAWAGLRVKGAPGGLTASAQVAAGWIAWSRLADLGGQTAWVVFYTPEDEGAATRLSRFVREAGLSLVMER